MGFWKRILKNLSRIFGFYKGSGSWSQSMQAYSGVFMFEGTTLSVQSLYDRESELQIPILRTYGAGGVVSIEIQAKGAGQLAGLGAYHGRDFIFEDGEEAPAWKFATMPPPAVRSWPGAPDSQAMTPRYVKVRILKSRSTTTRTFRLILQPPSKGIIEQGKGTLTISIVPKVGPAGMVGFLEPSTERAEASLQTFLVHRTVAAKGAVAVDWETEDGTGIAGGAYLAASGRLTWGDNDFAPKSFQVALLDVPADQTMRIRLSNPTPGLVISVPGNPLEVTVVHVDPGLPGRISHELTDIRVDENTVLTLKARRLGGNFGAIGCTRDCDDMTALAGTHYTDTTGSLSWADQDVADKSWTVTIGAVPVGEVREFYSRLHTPTGGAKIAVPGDLASIVIRDSTAPPPSPIRDVIVDEMFCYRQDSIEDEMSHTARDVHVGIMKVKLANVIGPGGGIASFGGGMDVENGDHSLVASLPMRFGGQQSVQSPDFKR
ncbi:MAG TPA: Calx-beta domain-containing protein [Candidatus Eisenbacteria bacterium]|nr:Calx-beta domain-containing protein [Candidatus Eisenbacteria bacterium]